MNIQVSIPPNAQSIMDALENAGFSAHVVGGPVRDSVMGIEPHDWDITTNATPDETLQVFSDWRVRFTERGLAHGTVVVMVDGENFEVTTHRRDVSCDGRHADVSFDATLHDDLARRDITINAMAFNRHDGLIDPFNGLDDIENRIIRSVGNAQDRIREDFSRMLRAIRFALRFGFEIENNTQLAIIDNAHMIVNVPAEVIFSEFEQIVVASNITSVKRVFRPVAMRFLPSFWNVDFRVLEQSPQDVVIRLAIVLQCHASNSVRSALRAFGCDNHTVNRVQHILDNSGNIMHGRVDVSRAIAENGLQAVRDVVDFQISTGRDVHTAMDALVDIIANDDCVSLRQLAVNGNDFVAIGLSGRDIGDALNNCLDAVIRGAVENNSSDIMDWFAG